MSEPRQIVREYVRAMEALLKIDDLSDDERQAVQDMVDRICEKLLNDGAA